MSDLQSSKQISLIRVSNGWLARGDTGGFIDSDKPLWVFASTASLCRALPALIGESGWEVKPERDARGHFVKKDTIPPVIFKTA